MNSNAAKGVIRARGLKYIIAPDNEDDERFNVIDQYPKGGTSLPKGSTIYLYKE